MNMPIEQAAKTALNFQEFIILIWRGGKANQLAMMENTPLADEWREKYIKPLEGAAVYHADFLELDELLTKELQGRTPPVDTTHMSTRQMATLVNGEEWAALYAESLANDVYKYSRQRWAQLSANRIPLVITDGEGN